MRGRNVGISAVVATVLSTCLLASDARAASCSFVYAAGVIFGTYDVFDSGPLDSTGNITFLCNGIGPTDMIVVELSPGGASSPLSRRMQQGSTLLYYNLYLDAAHTHVWGNGMDGTLTYGPLVPPNGTNTAVTIYGRIPARQNVSVGMYSDTIVATILF